jgi:hypothetical protein
LSAKWKKCGEAKVFAKVSSCHNNGWWSFPTFPAWRRNQLNSLETPLHDLNSNKIVDGTTGSGKAVIDCRDVHVEENLLGTFQGCDHLLEATSTGVSLYT